jgi:beta-hydroxylase
VSAKIFKIFTPEQWRSFEGQGVFAGSPDDRRDGFIHLSTAEQVAGTLAGHFAAHSGLVLAEVEASGLETTLKFEASRGGGRFPHLYADLPMTAVRRIWPIRRIDGKWNLPPEFPG